MDRYAKAFLIVAVALLALGLYTVLQPFLGALAWGFCLASLLMPLQRWLSRKLNGRSGIAAGLLTASVPLVIVVPVFSIGLAFVDEAADLIKRIKAQPLHINGGLLAQFEQIPFAGRLVGFLREQLTATRAQLERWLENGVSMLAESLIGSGGNFLLGAIETFFHFFLMLFLLFFLLRDGRAMLARALRLVPMERQRSTELLALVGNTIQAVFYGEVFTALGQGALVGIGFAIAGLPSAVVFGVVAGVLALLPVGGTAIVWLPAVIYLFADSEPGWAVFMLIWGAGISVIDNLMRPLLISSQAPVSTLVVFVGVVGGISAYGMIGVIVGPVLLTVVLALLRFFEQSRAGRA